MGGTLRRRARRMCCGAAAVCLVLAFSVPSSPAQDDDAVLRPDVFRSSASSQVASLQVDRDALLPVADLFRFIALDGSGTYESSTRQARASLLFPGNGLIIGPSLACGTFGDQFPPSFKPILDACLQYKYPLAVFADDLTPDGSTAGSVALGAPTDAVSGTAIRAQAHAGEDAATTVAEMQSLRVLGLPALGQVIQMLLGVTLDTTLLSIDSAASRTNQRIENGSLVVDAESTVSGISLVGGLIRIGSLRSVSRITDDAKGTRTADADLEVAGVTVAGIPAQITADGLVLGSSGSGPLVEQLMKVVNDLLRAVNIRIEALASEENVDDNGNAVARASGLLIELALPVQGLPTIPGPIGDIDPNGTYKASLQLAATGVRGSAVAFDDVPPVPRPAVVGGGGVSPSRPSGSTGSSSTGRAPAAPVTPAPAPANPETAAAPEQVVQAISDVFGGRVGFLYLSLMFAVLGLAIVPRLAVPARLPGPSS